MLETAKMRYPNNRIRIHTAFTILEMVIALSMMAVIMAIIPPLLRTIRNNWDFKQAAAEILQSGSMLTEHLNRNLAKSVKITSVSDASTTTGYIQFEDNSGNDLRYEVVNSYVQFGAVGNMVDLAGPVDQLQFTCYDSNEIDTPISDVNSIRFVEVETTLTNSSAMGQNENFTTSVYLRTNANIWEEGISGKIPFEFDLFEGKEPALTQIDNTHYLCVYRGWGSDGKSVVLTVNPTTWTVTKGTTFEFDNQKGEAPALAKIDNRHYLCVYEGDDDDGWATVLTVNTDTWIITKETSCEFDNQKGETPALTKIDGTHYLCAYEGDHGDGWATVLTVDTDTWAITKETPYKFDTKKCETPALAKIDYAHYLCVYEGDHDDGWATVLTVDTDTWAITKNTPFEFDTKKGKTPALAKVDDTHYLCAYAGNGDDGWATVLAIDTDIWSITKGTSYEFDTQKGETPVLSKIDDTHHLCAYSGNNDDGWAVVLNVNLITWTISKGTALEYDTSKSKVPALEKIDSNHYLCVYQGNNDDGWSVVLEEGLKVRP